MKNCKHFIFICLCILFTFQIKAQNIQPVTFLNDTLLLLKWESVDLEFTSIYSIKSDAFVYTGTESQTDLFLFRIQHYDSIKPYKNYIIFYYHFTLNLKP